MPIVRASLSADDIAQQGDAIYAREIRAQVESRHQGQVVAIDVKSHAFKVADTALAASQSLLGEYPDAEIWCVRVGQSALHRIGTGYAEEHR